MGADAMLASLRSYLLAKPEITAWVAERVYVARADVAGVLPAVVLELAGGQGSLNEAHDETDIKIMVWSSSSWSEALTIVAAVHASLRRASYVTGLPAPLLRITGGAPIQMPEGDYYHVVSTYTVVARAA